MRFGLKLDRKEDDKARITINIILLSVPFTQIGIVQKVNDIYRTKRKLRVQNSTAAAALGCAQTGQDSACNVITINRIADKTHVSLVRC